MRPSRSPASVLLTTRLREVSRSFYLTLRVLPRAVRPPIGLAYLLARTTDTIADTRLVTPARRLEALQALRTRILGQREAPVEFGDLLEFQGLAAEKRLLIEVEEAIGLLEATAAADRRRIRRVLETIISGQELDLVRFGEAGPGRIVALTTDAELEDYIYRVAGCVGEFWTELCLAHLLPPQSVDTAQLLSWGVDFGKGLQLVNVLRDLAADLRQGRCYLPTERLGRNGSSSEALLGLAGEPRAQAVYSEYLDRAERYLEAGWAYTNHLPRGHLRLRLACAWPVLIGMRTLVLLRKSHFLDSDVRVKVPRGEVRRLIGLSLLGCVCPALWDKLLQRARGRTGRS